MRKNIRFILLLSVLLISIFGLSACGNKVADENQIKQELEANQEFNFLKEGEQIDEIAIEKRQTEKDQKTDTVWCSVVVSDSEVSCQKNVVLSYGLYDKTGWILDDIEVEPKAQWIMTPLKGINQNDALAFLYGHSVIVDNEEWVITEQNLIKANVEEQQTNLDEKKDQVTISITLDEEVEKAEGKVEVSYFFNQKWEFDSILSNTEFTASMKEEYALNVKENDLISKMTETEITFGESGSRQTISTQTQEVSDFNIDEYRTESKGCQQIYQCSYNLNKPHVVLRIEATITYVRQNEGGWKSSVTNTTAKVISTNIEGDWVGTYNAALISGRSELHISDVQEDGTVTATYRFIPETITKYSSVGSYELSGHWDSETLELFLEAGEWIEAPEKESYNNSKNNITAKLDIEEGQLKGSAQGNNSFKVKNLNVESD